MSSGATENDVIDDWPMIRFRTKSFYVGHFFRVWPGRDRLLFT